MSYTKLRQTLAEVLGTAYQTPDEDVVSMLPEKEDDFDESKFKTEFLALDKERIKDINQKGKDRFDQGYSKAKKEERSNFESEIRTEFSIEDDDLIGVDLVKKVIELNSETDKGDSSKLTDEQLKSHPLVIQLLNDKDKAFKEQIVKVKEDYESKISGFHKDKVMSQVSKKALSILDGMNPILSEDPIKASNQKDILISKLKQFEYQSDGEDFIPLKEGKRLEDGHAHGVSFEQHVKGIANLFYDFKKAKDRDTPQGGDGSGGDGDIKVPKTEAEYVKIVTDTKIPLAERQKIRQVWTEKQKAS